MTAPPNRDAQGRPACRRRAATVGFERITKCVRVYWTCLEMLTEALRLYRDHGARKVLERGYLRAVRRSRLTPLLKSALTPLQYEKLVMAACVGYWPNIEEPRSYAEHVAHRKYCTDNDLYATVADKWACRDYVAEKVGTGILNEVYHVTDDPATIPFGDLPEKFVVKATHASGWNVVVEDKGDADFAAIEARCRRWVSSEYGVDKGEYWYGDIEPRVIVERYLEDRTRPRPVEYKFHVFHGEVKFVEAVTKRGTYDPDEKEFSEHRVRLFDREWTPLDVTVDDYPRGPVVDEPARLDEMIEIAETLGEAFAFARIDLYSPNGEAVVFGEITLAPGSARERYTPTSFDFRAGSYCSSAVGGDSRERLVRTDCGPGTPGPG